MDRSRTESGAADTDPLAARTLVPRFSDLLYVLAAPSTYAIVAGPLLIGAAKVFVLRDIANIEPWPYLVPGVVALDVAVFLGISAIVASLENRHRGLRILTLPVVIALFALSVANAFYLTVAGEQLAIQSLRTGVNRFSDVARIVGEVLKWIPPVVGAAVAAVLVAPWLLARTMQRKVVLPGGPNAGTRRARWTAAAAVMALLTWMASPDSAAMPVRALQRNVLVQMAVGHADVERPSGGRAQIARRPPVADARLEALASRRGPNVVMIVVESLRRQSTSLVDGSRVDTPTLRSLAARGLNVVGARAAYHTRPSRCGLSCAAVGRRCARTWPRRQLGSTRHVCPGCLRELGIAPHSSNRRSAHSRSVPGWCRTLGSGRSPRGKTSEANVWATWRLTMRA